jgi:hypothetical protein
MDPKRSKFAPSVALGVYRCPADRSMVVVKGQSLPRVRIMSMSQAFGPGDWLDPAGFQVNPKSKKYRVLKVNDLQRRFVLPFVLL